MQEAEWGLCSCCIYQTLNLNPFKMLKNNLHERLKLTRKQPLCIKVIIEEHKLNHDGESITDALRRIFRKKIKNGKQ